MLGLWAKRGIAAVGAMEGAGEAMLASYLFDYILFKLGKFVCDSQVVISSYRQGRLGLGYK